MDTKTAMIVFGIVSLVCISGWHAWMAYLLFTAFHAQVYFAIICVLAAFGPVAMLIAAGTGGGGLATLAGVWLLIGAIWGVPPHGLDVD